MTRTRQKLIVSLVLLVAVVSLVAFPLSPALASVDCDAAGCTTAQVGPFMEGISEKCGEKGTCSLVDIQTVFVNVGNWVLGVVGALVLLAYVVGGFYFLLSGLPGMEKYREKGKTALKMSTMGLVIVFVAYAAIQTLNNVLQGGGLGDAGYVVCGPGDTNAGLACGLNSSCTTSGLCVTECEQNNPSVVEAKYVEWSECKDTDLADSNFGFNPGDVTVVSGPTPDLCPGDETIQCVRFRYVRE